MKIKRINYYCDEICGKEGLDYIGEFSPHRLSVIRYEEDSEEIFDADEEKTILKP
ncbi:MAG: hypothetical protein IJ306_00295 [Oscillospiraceae bacterium]|nr:hypothetical protein [Oscillospiraceae bacterium]